MRHLYDIYTACMPALPVPYALFCKKLLPDDGATVLEKRVGDAVAGFCIVQDFGIRMLCVLPEYRRRGIGTWLLRRAEAAIATNGHARAVLGSAPGTYLFQGVPVLGEAIRFFERRGYSATWSSIDMTLDLRDYAPHTRPIDGLALTYAEKEDLPQLLSAVAAVDENWVRYYESNAVPALIARCAGKIVGFTQVITDCETYVDGDGKPVGALGCVGTLPAYRGRGFGLRMVDVGTRELAKAGCGIALIGYTYLEDWYGKLGYRTHMRFWMGEKAL